MPIVSSVLTTEAAQADGRRWLTEVHTDHMGQAHTYPYLAEAGLDGQAVMAGRAIGLPASLAQDEVSANVIAIMALGSAAVVSLNHSVIADNRTALRQAYQSATQVQAVMIADFLATLTNVQLQTLFGLTAGQVTTMRTNRLTPAVSAAAAIRAAAGQ